MNHLISITKSDGTHQLFEEEKLKSSLKRVGASDEVIEEILEEIGKTMHDGMTTNEIYGHAFVLLKKHSHHVAVKYSIRRALIELGPDGFPFEKFVSRVFQSWGYQTITDQTVLGKCISHEVDVVGWNKDKLIMAEAKFHNEFGMKSDSKVALYINARREDLAETFFDYGGIKRKISEFWLVTNTKFTDQAIIYGECNHLHMLGWNYPVQGNLHEIIEKNALHPVTCITGLNHQQKKDLVGRNIVTCSDLIRQPQILESIGIKNADAEKIVNEAKLIIKVAK
ncbi:MAG: ATP cone domain-containing protein [Candidatus Pacebacteria bacterium]|nr:ATP cone domain-containing protein [Candidatus Paceibacterota bacterium]